MVILDFNSILQGLQTDFTCLMSQHPVDKTNQERVYQIVCNTVGIELPTEAVPVALIGMNTVLWTVMNRGHLE